MPLEKIVKDAKRNATKGIEKYSIVTSGKRASKEELKSLCEAYSAIENEVPLNLLNPIEGTPLYGIGGVDEGEFYKTCAICRLIHPKAVIRLAGGRGLDHEPRILGGYFCIEVNSPETLIGFEEFAYQRGVFKEWFEVR